MKKRIQLLVLVLSFTSQTFSQIIVDKGIYKVNFSNELHVPRWVSYYLYKGGGDCNRTEEHFTFKNDMPELLCAKNADYNYSKWKYEKGHLANAEDFAMSCTKEELTFRYYNCMPQTKSANHDYWLANETEIRKWSQKEKLYIVTGGYFRGKKTGKNKDIAVPDWCWKVVQSVKTKKVLFCGIFTNEEESKLTEMPVSKLEGKLKSRIILVK